MLLLILQVSASIKMLRMLNKLDFSFSCNEENHTTDTKDFLPCMSCKPIFMLSYSRIILVALSLLCIVIKLLLFFMRRSENDKLKFLFYFPSNNISNSKNLRRIEFKNKQNLLSLLILTLGLAYLFIVFYIRIQYD